LVGTGGFSWSLNQTEANQSLSYFACAMALCPLGVAAFQGALAFQGVLDASAIQLLEPEARFARSITSIQI